MAGKHKGGRKHKSGKRAAATGEVRSFEPSAEAPAPRRAADEDPIPHSVAEGRLGPGADPAEGKP